MPQPKPLPPFRPSRSRRHELLFQQLALSAKAGRLHQSDNIPGNGPFRHYAVIAFRQQDGGKHILLPLCDADAQACGRDLIPADSDLGRAWQPLFKTGSLGVVHADVASRKNGNVSCADLSFWL